jgi:hypothetical protein
MLFFAGVFAHVDDNCANDDCPFHNLLPVSVDAEQGQAVAQDTQDQAPTTAPETLPMPPDWLVPPMVVAAIAVSS